MGTPRPFGPAGVPGHPAPPNLDNGAPGAGKTVLLADWAHSYANGTVSWLTVDERDNEPRQFWRDLSMSLRTDGLRSDGPGHEGADNYWCEPESRLSVDGALQQVAHSQPRVLVVDDFHLVTDDEVIKSVARLVRRLPSHFRLVIAGRSDPTLPLRRLILTGEAQMIEGHELRFTLDECAALAALVAHKFLSLSELEALWGQSEGWAAGLHMGVMASRDHDNPAQFVTRFPSALAPVAEYLENEVLRHQSPEVVKFLLQTSVLAHLTPELCVAVSGRPDAARDPGFPGPGQPFCLPGRLRGTWLPVPPLSSPTFCDNAFRRRMQPLGSRPISRPGAGSSSPATAGPRPPFRRSRRLRAGVHVHLPGVEPIGRQ